ncbi:MAG: UDP-N-acetylmuramate--L-alanine ligase [Clostridiaceae bacterium]|nr:UDP-N-acetylmuramate--L-alanine ligase [Clostridiaceae bacterium]
MKKTVTDSIIKDFSAPGKSKHIHFIGIGGISMSGLAEIAMSFWHKVSGSDLRPSNITQKLERKGALVYHGHSEENINNPDMVVYTAAVKEDNPELRKALVENIPVIDRATMLGLLMKKYPYSVAVSGTHGKTTTTSMIAMIMLESGLDPTIHIGGELAYIGGTTRIGSSGYFVTEADEYCESFLKLFPHIGVIMNIEFDHPDYYKNLEHIKNSFLKFARNVQEKGHVVACADNENLFSILPLIPANIVNYGINNMSNENKADAYTWSAKNIEHDESAGCTSYILSNKGQDIDIIKLNVPGIHNVYNSLAAISACRLLGCDIKDIKDALLKFRAPHRRFELKGIMNNIKIVDDYAHHPSEIKATLRAARHNSRSRIWCIFQPHTYSRTKALLEDFASAFADADIVILADIYAARETDNNEINSEILAEKINAHGKKAIYMAGFDDIAHYVENNARPGDMIITMGAGDIYKVGEILLKNSPPATAV